LNKQSPKINLVKPDPESQSERKNDLFRFSHFAMATIFEILIRNDNKNYAEKTAQAGFNEIDRLELELSRFIANSEISKINSLKQFGKTIISVDTWNCLKACNDIYQDTWGTFDISAGPIIDLWKKREPESNPPSEEQIETAREQTGLPWLHLNESEFEVQLMNSGIRIDLGGFGKGYALDRAAEIMLDWDIPSFLVHSGYSTVLAGGNTPDINNWPLSITHPIKNKILFSKFSIVSGAFSGSGLEKGKHIIDPRTGYPVNHHLAAWAEASTAGLSDALSTAFMIMNDEEISDYCRNYPEVKGIVIKNDKDNSILKFGYWDI
jgi:thiamine biosynthesis lipoprotein